MKSNLKKTTPLKILLAIIFICVSIIPHSKASAQNPAPNNTSSSTIKSNCVITKLNNFQGVPILPPECNTETAKCDTKAPNNLNSIVESIKDDGITLAGSDLNQERATAFYNVWCLLKKSSRFTDLLATKNDPIQFSFKPISEAKSPAAAYNCGGFANATGKPRTIELYGVTIGAGCTREKRDFVIAHEIGHFIDFKHPNDIYGVWYSKTFNPSSPLPTYSCVEDYGKEGGPYPHECFADMIAEYVYYKSFKYLTTPPIKFPEFKTTYINQYNFAKDNIFGGIEY